MAQGSKSRIVIWTIVGILVVVAAAMLITKPKATASQPPVNTDRFVRTMTSRLDKLQAKVVAAQADFPGAPAEQWQKINDGIAAVRQILVEMPGISEEKILRSKVDDANKAYLGSKKAFKEITGKEDNEEPAGGE